MSLLHRRQHIREWLSIALMAGLALASASAEAQDGGRLAPVPKDGAMDLNAGPISLKLADGELRYLYVGKQEIIRRIYFAVRDMGWDTPPAQFSRVHMRKNPDSFEVDLSARVQQGDIDFSWQGKITGTRDGRITFRVDGQANADFKCNRFGFCVLYGADSMAGQSFEIADDKAEIARSVFPKSIRPDVWPHTFRSLRYVTDSEMEVITSLAPVLFGLEDQRNWADSSHKAFSAMDYPYPNIVRGAPGTETVTVEVRNPQAEAAPDAPLRVTIGAPLAGARLPVFLPLDATAKKGFFLDVNTHPDEHRQAKMVAWPFTPTVNLFDDDTLIENLPAIQDQAEAARRIAPHAVLRLAPLTFNSPWPRPTRDARTYRPFAAAWLAAATKHLAAGGIAEAMIDVGPAYALLLADRLKSHAGSEVLSTTIEGPIRPRVEALAIKEGDMIWLWLANLSPESGRVIDVRLPEASEMRLGRINERTPLAAPFRLKKIKAARSALRLSMYSYEVCEIQATQK